VQNTELRPLGAGEMLDRAITLYVRRFALIVTVLAVVTVPLMVLQGLVAPESARAFSELGRVFAASADPHGAQKAADAMALDSRMSPAGALLIFASVFVRVLMWCAILAVVAAAYAGHVTRIGDAYRLALKRWFPQMVVGLAFMLLGMFALIPVFVLYIMLIFALVALAALHLPAVAIVAGIAGGVVVLGGALVIGALVFMAYELAAVAIVTETGNPMQAIGIGLRRAFAPGMKRRTLAAGLVLLVVTYAGTLPVIAAAVLVTALTHVEAAYFAIMAVGTVLLDGLVAAFVVVYAVDVRVRREGFDLVVPEATAPA
jgi:hypothetical protein